MWRLQQKLKIPSRRLTQWSKEEIGNVFDQVIDWETNMQHHEKQDLNNNTDIYREALNKGHVEYVKWMGMQDALLKQKSKDKWFENRDSNASYFHSLIRDRRRKLQLHRIMNHRNRWVEDDENIGKATIHHFQNLFNFSHQFRDQDILNCIPQCITEKDNIYLTTIPDMKEITEVVFNMSASNSTGPDGYNITFFHKCWDIIKDDIKEFVQDFFSGKSLSLKWNLQPIC
ncbi:uncharacterized protein [Nicotiana tomentosiformis]|uniref:uncharacterized protein n=1 Tax=Nicotiana tomentosiformis TaxID=4098 RepID=UPI000878FC44|nr:uncharacterized protein LOC108945517 [Nicotiana tomentosiformis]